MDKASNSMNKGMNKVQELSKSLMRKFRKIEYKNVTLAEGFQEAEDDYRIIRNTSFALDNSLKSFSNYEHGTDMYRRLKQGLEYLNDKTSLKMYKSRDMYEEASTLGEGLKELGGNSSLQKIAQQHSEVFHHLSEAKKNHNRKLAVLKEKLKESKEKSREIDSGRNKLKNLRYDLEMMLQKGKYDEGIKSIKEKEYEHKSKEVLRAMRDFLRENEIGEVMKGVMKEERKYYEEAAAIFKTSS